jgi:hypothetical protein
MALVAILFAAPATSEVDPPGPASPAASDSTEAGCPGSESLILEAADGFQLHISMYRPVRMAPAAILLVSDGKSDPAECWAKLPSGLCAAGCQVLILDPRGTGRSRMPDQLPYEWERPTEPLRRRFELDLRQCLELVAPGVERICLVTIGWTGSLVPRLAGRDARITHHVWIAPAPVAGSTMRGWLAGGGGDEGGGSVARDVELLLVAAQTDAQSYALAGDLYSQMDEHAELRLLAQGEGGCQLVQHHGLGRGLVAWISDALHEGTGDWSEHE